MRITTKWNTDLSRQAVAEVLDAVQGDANTRCMELHLLENGTAWTVPEGVTGAVSFRKPDGHKGLYDTLPDGSGAVTVTGNTVTAILAPQVLTCAGDVAAAVVLLDKDLNRLATFPFTVHVAPDPSAGKRLSNDYYQYSTMEAVNGAVEAVRAAAAEAAAPIVCDAAGDSLSVTDAACRPLRGLTLYGKTTQEGTPSPEAPIDLVSAGSDGSIVVSVTDGTDENIQTLTAATPNGLPGVPVPDAAGHTGNYTDASGRQWHCDEIDFGRGVYVRRIATKVLDGSEAWNKPGGSGDKIYFTSKLGEYGSVFTGALSTHFQHKLINSSSNDIGFTVGNSAAQERAQVQIRPRLDITGSVESFRAWLAKNPVTVQYALTTPEETPLSAEEIAAFKALHSSKPNTAVSNDAGAGMGISYIADTKTYIDDRITGLRDAILSAGANI